MKPLYTAHVTSQGGGREGHVKSNDGLVDFNMRPPKELGGSGGAANPELLFAAGYASCFEGALQLVSRREKLKTGGVTVTAHVSIGSNDAGGFSLAVKLDIEAPEMTADEARRAVDLAHQVCPYSNATRGNIPVELNITKTA